MAERAKLPRGFRYGTGEPEQIEAPWLGTEKTEDGERGVTITVVQPEGVIVGPPEPYTETHTFRCPRCGNTIESESASAVCHGLNLKVDPNTDFVYSARIGETSPLTGSEIRTAGHTPVDMEVVA